MPVKLSRFDVSAPGKRICFWGAPTNSQLPSGNLLDQLAMSGANTGNMFIGHGLFHNTICEKKSYIANLHAIPAEHFHEEYDFLFIPASNFINVSSDLGAHYEYFSRTKVPILCFGLGSQLLPHQEITLKPGTERLIRLISERSGSVGVRGAFTAEVLNKMGIRNVSLTGCPSLLSFTDDHMKRLTAGRPSLDKLAVNFSNNVRRHAIDPASFSVTENNLFRSALNLNSFYILQNETPEIELLAAIAADDKPQAEAILKRIGTAFDVNEPESQVDNYLKWRTRVFFSVDDWINCMTTMTGSVGSRFHGNIAALLAGTPALFLVHDMRTLELCELLRVPHLVLDRPYRGEEVLNRLLDCDYSGFERQFHCVQNEWKEFLGRNGLKRLEASVD